MLNEDPSINLSLLADAVEATQTSFIITDHTVYDDPIIFCNTAFERLTGHNREEIIGKNCRFLQAGDTDQPELDKLRNAIAQGENITVTLRNYRKDGSAFLNELSISPVKSNDGAITHLIGIQREKSKANQNITEQFRHEWRTPITIVKTTLQLLQQRGLIVDPDFLNKSLDSAIRAINRLENLGHNL